MVLADLELKYGDWIRTAFEGVFSSLEKTGDDALISKGYEQFRDVAITSTAEEVKDLSYFIEKIDWSNPIDSAYALNQEIERGTGLTKEYAQGMLEVDSSFFSAGNQMQYFLKSSEFEDMKE